jgi:hypothetical protein
MNAKLAFTAISQIPLFGSRAAAMSCCREASRGVSACAVGRPRAGPDPVAVLMGRLSARSRNGVHISN